MLHEVESVKQEAPETNTNTSLELDQTAAARAKEEAIRVHYRVSDLAEMIFGQMVATNATNVLEPAGRFSNYARLSFEAAMAFGAYADTWAIQNIPEIAKGILEGEKR